MSSTSRPDSLHDSESPGTIHNVPIGTSETGSHPVYGGTKKFQTDPHWRDLILFYEYFYGDNCAGIGAGHQIGWTGLVAKLIQQCAEHYRQRLAPEPTGKEALEYEDLETNCILGAV